MAKNCAQQGVWRNAGFRIYAQLYIAAQLQSQHQNPDEHWNINSAIYLYSTPGQAIVTRTSGTSPSSGRWAKIMRTVFTIILTFSLLSLKAQTTKTISVSTDKQNHFNNQGEQEDYWTQQFFKDNYVKQSFDKYNGNIYASGDSIKYLDQIFIVFNIKANLKDIFLKGLFYPAIITGQTKADTIKISNFEELSFTNKNATQKRYRFWLYQKRLLNPTVCFIELTNPNATDKTDSKTFLEGASLTFYKTGWIII